ncbi:putative matrix-remodeling-associated protein 7-like [Apostichopus japonicus]|uniref:Putative matrix-remodeling-associated protein 7-like n=1 Tax=Stichopus japonicus TaxID=307972 RepID=A0A2G8LHD7_STIJA|nr:putative matrix-remodeling-associated protein 7-like [Apostichopus japonicus]
MSELVLETEYLFFTVASVATLLVVILSWRVLQSKKDTQRGSEENQGDGDDQVKGKHSEDELADVDNLLIKSSELKILDSKDLQKLQEGEDQGSPSKSSEDPNVKRVRAKELEEELVKEMTDSQLDEERRVREEQLAAIFKLMEENQDRFGVDSVEDVKSQYKLYA